MGFNGSGVFQRVRNWVADATAGIKIRADYHDAEDDGFAAGLSNCITKDGQTLVTQNIPFNSKRITGLADPINPQDAATMASVGALTSDKLPLAGGTITGDLTVDGTATFGGASAFAGASTFTGTATFGGPVTITGTLTGAAGSFTTLHASDAVTFATTLNVAGVAAFNSSLYVAAGAVVVGAITGDYHVSNAHMTVGNGVLYMNAANSVYFQYAGAQYNAPHGPIVAANGRLWGSGDFPSPAALISEIASLAARVEALERGTV